jgi:hypothetical protein
MKLNLRNPLIFFDLETTGIDVALTALWRFPTENLPNGDEESKP